MLATSTKPGVISTERSPVAHDDPLRSHLLGYLGTELGQEGGLLGELMAQLHLAADYCDDNGRGVNRCRARWSWSCVPSGVIGVCLRG